MRKIKIFVDSDVVISSFLSNKGAAYELVKNTPTIVKLISNYSQRELQLVMKRLEIEEKHLELLKNDVQIIKLQNELITIKKMYNTYVFDKDDAHIVGAAKNSNAQFITTYNIKDFNVDEIKKNFGIIVIKPANFLQYLRSIM